MHQYETNSGKGEFIKYACMYGHAQLFFHVSLKLIEGIAVPAASAHRRQKAAGKKDDAAICQLTPKFSGTAWTTLSNQRYLHTTTSTFLAVDR
jgi:hypothetical protein